MKEWIMKYWLEVLFSGVVGAFGLALKHFKDEMKKYKKLLDDRENQNYTEIVKEQIKPVDDKVKVLEKDIEHIIDSYRYRIITLCQLAINKGYLSQGDFEQLTEMFKLYTALGGNGQAAEFYSKAKMLPIKSYEEIERMRREKEYLEIQQIVKEEFEQFKMFLLEQKKEGTQL